MKDLSFWKAASRLDRGRLALRGLILSVLLGLLVPIYSDETAWRFQERAGIDGVDILMSDVCGPNTLARPPWFMMPVRQFSAAANALFADPLFIRIEGVICALAWLGLLWLLTAVACGETRQCSRLRTLAFSLLGLGVLPFLLVLSRPEQGIILATTAALLVSQARVRMAPQALAWAKAAAIVMLTVVALSYHMKGVLYTPVMLAALACCAHGRETRVPRLAGAVAVAMLGWSAAHYWVDRLACPGDPVVAASHARENIAVLFASEGGLLGKLGMAASGANPLKYVLLVVPNDKPHSAWLPVDVFPSWLGYIFASIMLLLWGAGLLLGIRALVLFAMRERWNAWRKPAFSLAAMILAVVLVWAFSQLNKNFYESAHVLPMLAVFIVLSLSLEPRQEPDRWFAFTLRIAVPVAVASQVLVAAYFAGPLIAAMRTPGYLDAQPFSISAGGYAAVQQDIRRVMLAEGMAADERSRRLVVDELTYLPLQQTRMPLHRLGVLTVLDGSMHDPLGYMRSRGSTGIVVGCRYLKPSMLAVASRSGEICAISAKGLARLSAMARPASSAGRPRAQ